ncbi:GTPase-activating protein, putative [Plasmodium gallinaceum]|uniref:GTPase-activating protein, putative n=1 Tax=Plasmodium gallinaceum TaxID=5849 RepID=A0A1J1GZ30_PLAGA|nr:GTPase-activating protein, putative [Plasmodium gallinaceum]CRG97843.1 GTPase-activating protein, putative [Plasmodium gallinaceum]
MSNYEKKNSINNNENNISTSEKKNEINDKCKNVDNKNGIDSSNKTRLSNLQYELKSNEKIEDSELKNILEVNEQIEDGNLEDNMKIKDDKIERKTDKEDEGYLAYCDNGYLRGLLKNAVVSSSVYIFLGTKIISFLNEKERYICSFTCKLLFFEVYSIYNLKDLYKNKFISNDKRSFIWKAILLADNTFMSENLYRSLKKRNSDFDKIIEKDIYRTFPHNPYFLNKKENMQKKLLDILKVCSLYFKSVGYCQGMNYIAAIFLLVFKNKLDTVRCFISLLVNFNLKGMFIYNFPELKKVIYQLNILIKAYMPKLFYFFRRKKIKIDFFCINWFMTLFSLDLSLENTLKLWDIFFLFGLKILIKLSLIILHHHQKKILNMTYDEALTFLKSITKSSFIDYLFDEKNFFNYLKKFKVTNRILRQIIMLKKSKEKIEIQVRKNDGKIKCSVVSKNNSKNKLKNSNHNNLINRSNFIFNQSFLKSIHYEYFNIKLNKRNTWNSNEKIKEDIVNHISNNDNSKNENVIIKENNAFIETNTYYDFNLTKSFE